MTDKELLQQNVFCPKCHNTPQICRCSHEVQPEETVNGWPIWSGLPHPEPVAWQVKFRDDDGIPQIAWFPHPVHPESNLAKRPYIEEPLYAAPPKKEWVCLTDEEMRQATQAMDAEPLAQGWRELIKFAKAIEAKLKEKNT